MSVNTMHQNQSMASFLFPLDHNCTDLVDAFVYKRGPRYEAYAHLRESKLKAKRTHSQFQNQNQSNQEEGFEEVVERRVLTPKKEVVKLVAKRAKGSSSVLAQSVPDFSAVLRKENRKPSSPLPPVAPTALKSGRGLGGSKSVNSGEKRGGSVLARKSYASIEELKGLASIARGAINGENKGGVGVGGGVGIGVATRASTRNALRYSRHF